MDRATSTQSIQNAAEDVSGYSLPNAVGITASLMKSRLFGEPAKVQDGGSRSMPSLGETLRRTYPQ